MTGVVAEQRATPLADRLKEQIQSAGGAISVHDYMHACGRAYYARGRVFGASGDFVTAPEISQIFGELIGAWCAVAWRQMGSPPAFNLVELGPGRGTMMADALRAMARMPDCRAAVRVSLIEASPALRATQGATLGGSGVQVSWPDAVAEIETLPSIVLANEFVDALPVHQLVWFGGRWCTRVVTLDADGHLAFAAGAPNGQGADEIPLPAGFAQLGREARDGDILELRAPAREVIDLARFQALGVAALLIDYGHAKSAIGDTLQAVRGHLYEHPLTSPGEADLSAHVDFADLGRQIAAVGLTVEPLVTQGAFLAGLGITERASRLMNADPAGANAIEMAVARLLSPSGMGTRFKVLGARSPHLPPLPGWPA